MRPRRLSLRKSLELSLRSIDEERAALTPRAGEPFDKQKSDRLLALDVARAGVADLLAAKTLRRGRKGLDVTPDGTVTLTVVSGRRRAR